MSLPTPEQLAKSGSEHAEQVALFCWAATPSVRELYPELRWMFAIPNGGLRDKVTAGKMKAEGVRSGVSDIFLPMPKQLLCGLFIEMKVAPNKPTKEQIEFMDAMRERGYMCSVCYSWQEARDVLVSYLTD